MAFLAYNGKFLMRTGKWIGYSNVEPAPISGDGVIRFRFYNSDSPIDLEFLNELTRNEGQWVQVLDANTGLPIDGLWDYNYEFYSGSPIRNYFSGMTSSDVLGADVDIVEIKDSRIPPISGFWGGAFSDATALRKVHITQLAPGRDSLRMFDNCSGLIEAYVKCEAFGSTEAMFSGCRNLHKLYISTSDGLENGMYSGCSSLSELTVEWTGSADGYYLYNAMSALSDSTSLSEVTLIHPNNVTVYLGNTGDNGVFQNKTLLTHVHHLANYGNNVLVPDALPVSGQIEYLFSGCTVLKSIPTLRATGTIQCSNAFNGCRSVESGILAAYNALAPMTEQYQHRFTFRNCGVDSSSGAAELAQIPSDWK